MAGKDDMFEDWKVEVGTELANPNLTAEIMRFSGDGSGDIVLHLRRWAYTPFKYNGELYTVVKKLQYGDLGPNDAPENIIYKLPKRGNIYGLYEERTPEMRQAVVNAYSAYWPGEKARRERAEGGVETVNVGNGVQ